MTKKVYAHLNGNKVTFSFRSSAKASIAGQFEQTEYDEQTYWHYRPSPGLSNQPSQKWLYKNWPRN